MSSINAIFYNRTLLIKDEKWNYGKWNYLFQCPTNDYPLPDPYKDEIFRQRAIQGNYSQWEKIFNIQVPGLQQLYSMPEAHKSVAPCIWRLSELTEMSVNEELERIFGKKENSKGKSYPFKNSYQDDENPEYVAIHVRRGDKLIKESKFVSINEHVELLEFLVINHTSSKWTSQKEFPKVFIASDDMQSVLSDLKRFRPKWNLVYRKSADDSSGHFQEAFNQLSFHERVQKAIDLIVDIEIARRARLVVCGITSLICRLIQYTRFYDSSTLLTVNDAPLFVYDNI